MIDRPNQADNKPYLSFQPHPLVRNPHIQALLSCLFQPNGGLLHKTGREMILNVGDGVRLQGYYSPQAGNKAKGLVLLLHGWLGSANSNYVLAIGEYLYRRGYAIFRLNLRDHGDTHHLNPGPGHGDLLDETFTAVQRIAQLEADRPLHLVGVSLGGNFALRLAWRHTQMPLPNLHHTISICPVVNPYRSTLSLDAAPGLYQRYFRGKWRRSLARKQAMFPELYDFSVEMTASSCMEMTQIFVDNHSPYPNATAYFESCAVTSDLMAALRTPTTIITAVDDPIVPVADFYAFADLSPYLQLYFQSYGGHAGFFDILPLRSWIPAAVLTIMER
jgi:predicted alpha/beta-fold hydrolase